MTTLQSRICLLLAVLCLLVVAGNVALAVQNRQVQLDYNQRQQQVQQGVTRDGAARESLRLMADAAVRGNDPDMRAVLQRQGITLPNPAPAAASKGRP